MSAVVACVALAKSDNGAFPTLQHTLLTQALLSLADLWLLLSSKIPLSSFCLAEDCANW